MLLLSNKTKASPQEQCTWSSDKFTSIFIRTIDDSFLVKVSLNTDPDVYSYFLSKYPVIKECVSLTKFNNEHPDVFYITGYHFHSPAWNEPAIKGVGMVEYLKNNQMHRENEDGSIIGVGPARVVKNNKAWYYKNERHRVGPNGDDEGAECSFVGVLTENSPFVKANDDMYMYFADGTYTAKTWKYFGKIHRKIGPAIEILDKNEEVVARVYVTNGRITSLEGPQEWLARAKPVIARSVE